MPLRTEVGLVPRDIALDGTHLSQGGDSSPHFGPCIVAKQLDGSTCHLARRPWPRQDYVRWGHSCLTKKGGQSPPIFGPCLLWTNGWIDQDATWYWGRLWPWRHCVRRGPSSPIRCTVPNFSCLSVVAKRSPISATDGHLSTYLTEELRNSKILHCVNERSVYSTGKHVQ